MESIRTLVLLLTALALEPALPRDRASGTQDPGQSRAGTPLVGPGTVLGHGKIGNGTPGFPDDLDAGQHFGSSIAPLGDLDRNGVGDLAVGAPDDYGRGVIRGAVWLLFLDPDGTAREHRKIGEGQGGFAGVLRNGDRFGSALAALGDLDGDGVGDLAVGARGDGVGGAAPTGRGAVWVLFLNADGTVRKHQKISVTQGGFLGVLDPDDQFGQSLSALGDLDGDGVVDLAVGAPGDDDGSAFQVYRGAVWVLFLNADGTVKSHQKISSTQGGFTGTLDNYDEFGHGLAALDDLDGDGVGDLAVGAEFAGNGGLGHPGAVWILFLDTDGTVKGHQRIDGQVGDFTGDLDDADFFGSALAAPGDLDGDGVRDLVVGAPGDDDGGGPISERGAVWLLFLRSDGTVASHRKISAAEGGFGGPLLDNDLFGSAVAAPGDIDGDGIDDLVVGALGDDVGGLPSYRGGHGAAWVLFSGPALTVRAEQRIGAGEGGLVSTLDYLGYFGSSVAWLGDLDGDGNGDLAVGAPRGSTDDPGEVGAVWILFLRADGTVRAFQEISAYQGGFTGALDIQDEFGISLAALGDLDGDGVGDLAVGAVGDDDGKGDEGAVWVLFLQQDGTVRAHQKVSALQGGFGGTLLPSDEFGSALSALGDIDGDGVGDLAAGAAGDGSLSSGAVWVLRMNPDGTVKAHQKIDETEGGFTGNLNDVDAFGGSLAALGDLDGDGTAELAVGAPFIHPTFLGTGSVWVLFLNPDGTVRAQQRIKEGEGGFTGDLANRDRFGCSLAALGDLDGDGIVDLAVGAEGDDDGGAPSNAESRGAVWVLFLETDGTVASHGKVSATEGGFSGDLDAIDGFGGALARIGDRNRDGVQDLAVGAPFDDDGGLEHGAVWSLALDGIATLDFEAEDDLTAPLVDGQSLSTPPELGNAVSIASLGANAGAALFDSSPGGPNASSSDRDLLVGLGNVLILQDSLFPTETVPGIFDDPGDDPDGGTQRFVFVQPVRPVSLNLVDIDSGRGQHARVTLFATTGKRVYSVPGGWTEDLLADGPPGFRTLDLTTTDPQPGYRSTARCFESAGFDPTGVIAIEVELVGSGALDDLRWQPSPLPAEARPDGGDAPRSAGTR